MVSAHTQLALLYSRIGDTKRAVDEFQAAASLQPKSAEVHNNLGVALDQAGDLPGAIAAFRRALDCNPKFVPALLNLGQAMREKGDLEAAISYYRQALQIEPNSASAHADLGFTLKRSDRLTEALDEVRIALRLDPRLARAHFYCAETLLQSGNSEAALDEYQQAAQLSPTDVEFRLKYGVALADKAPEDAVAVLKETAEQHPKTPEVFTALGTVLRKQGDSAGAAIAFRRAKELSGNAANRSEAVLQTNRAIELLKQGKLAPAIEALELALTEANHYMGIAQSAEARWPEADQAFRHAIQSDPSNPDIHYNFGVALEKQRDWSAAAKEFDAVIALRPGHAEATCRLADALFRSGDEIRGAKALTQAKELGKCDISAR
jgi:Tfp pilus assembly protein PilF